mgnify:FL=1
MGTISKNFNYREFEHSDMAERHDICNVIRTAGVRDAIKALTLDVLQPLRDAWGRPLHVNSGYRCAELNGLVGGVPSSQHVRGEAADIACDDPRGLAVTAVRLGLPFDQMILYPDFVHFSHRLEGPQRGQVLYNWRYKGEKL